MANTILPGYENLVGTKKMVIVDRSGPASYNNTGTYATSGDVLSAAELGLGGIDNVIPSQSSDGLNEIEISFPLNSGQAVPTIALHWFVTATGAEVANTTALNTKSIRLLVFGV